MNQKKLLILIVAAIVLLAGFCWSGYSKPRIQNTNTPGDTSAEAGFARDMGDHHQQAVDMSFIIRDKSTDKMVRILAFDIINTQATQRGIMMGWLEQWGLPQTTTRPALAWMSDEHSSSSDHESTHSSSQEHSEVMPGMASPEEIDRLRTLTSQEADVLFMQLMIRHHIGGISMANGVLKRTDRLEVKRLAQSMVDSQQAEIDVLKQMLEERGASL